MQLCIDAGNTKVKYALFRGRKRIHRVESDNFDSIENLLEKYEPLYGILSSVRKVPASWMSRLKHDVDLKVLTYQTPLPIQLDYKTPESLGGDRMAAAVGGHTRYKENNVLVINAGTCITFDIVTEKGIYLGGAISPGIEMRYQAMHQFTSRLPYVTNRKPVRITGKSTEESLNAGVLNHVCFEIDGAIDFYRSHYKKLKVLLTGGNGPFLAKRLKNSIFAAPDLVLSGLNEILLYNA